MPSHIREYSMAIGPSGVLYMHVKGQPHNAYSLDAFLMLIAKKMIVANPIPASRRKPCPRKSYGRNAPL